MANCNCRQPEYPGMMTRPAGQPIPGTRPAVTPQPMPGTMSRSRIQPVYQQPAACPEPVPEIPAQNDMYAHVDKLPVGMSYTPMQKFGETFDLCKALQVGTIFPDLRKPFCGKGGAR